MSRVPLGKVLLRNVIRHTDAHNKIQEETEMWKVRELEKQTETHRTKRRRASPDLNRWDHNGYKELYPEEFSDNRGRMRSDGFDAGGNREPAKGGAAAAVTLRQDALSVRAWNKKYSECEASIPDRWGHSGYKELYPEEFDTDSDREEAGDKGKANEQDKSRRKNQKEQESHKRKRSKKTHKKKQKKRSHKKLKKRRKEQEESTESSSESSDESEEKRKKSKRKKTTRKKRSKKRPSSSGQDSDSSSDEMSSTEDSEIEERKERWTEKSSKKHRSSHNRSKSKKDSETVTRKGRRTNWKVAKDKSSESSDED
ncbi:uncharacterized protein NKAPD1 isoform X2 [Pyxicephalus adspersus]|uniref:NKAP domain containing 1 n=2 Tax=Pyxicephalus adspersus TaxID=30357 RepID=A0AAV2ZQP3_PYXAD|nr:TPA: hypothetical protein GDO54_003616 [Pyxicephalus adspersus]